MSENAKKWYVLRAVGGKEKKAKEYIDKEIEKFKLQDYVDQVLVPTEKVYQFVDGKRVAKDRLLYPGYIYIHACLTPMIENMIRNEIPNVARFLTEKKGDKSGDKVPGTVHESEIARILGTQDESITVGGQTIVDFFRGDAVEVTDGPFSGFKGIVEEIVEDRNKLKVAVMIFGRKTLLELNFTQVTKE